MPIVTGVCFLFSLSFYGIGYSEMLFLKNIECNTYDSNTQVSLTLTISCFVLAIFFVVIGFLVFYIKRRREQKVIGINDIQSRGRSLNESADKSRTSSILVRTQLKRSKLSLDLDRRVSS